MFFVLHGCSFPSENSRRLATGPLSLNHPFLPGKAVPPRLGIQVGDGPGMNGTYGTRAGFQRFKLSTLMAKRIDLRKAVEAKAQQRRGRRGMISVFTKDPTRWEDNLFFHDLFCHVLSCFVTLGGQLALAKRGPGPTFIDSDWKNKFLL